MNVARNLGGTFGISLVQTMLVRNTAAAHAAMVERITVANPAWNNPAVAAIYGMQHAGGAAALDAMVTQQASMVAYIDDFRLMLYLTLIVIPLVLLLRPAGRANAAGIDAHAVMD
jgi:DHA2 family multidrug resistance protein